MTRVHILGASGTGTTTLGAVVAAAVGVRHVDADSIFWIPTDPPFTTRRTHEKRLALIAQQLPPDGSWVFSGSAIGWSEALEDAYQLIVFLHLDAAARL